VSAVTAGSLAERSGIKAGDRIVSVAGSRVSTAGAVAAAIRSAPAGTWLPLEIRRGENSLELVVKFPPKS
jgi:S1-C subfamily serine protease